LKVGDILTYSWGYDQTNVDAFEVVRESKASVWLRPIALEMGDATGPFSDQVTPVKGNYLSEKVLLKRRSRYTRPTGVNAPGEEFVGMDHGVATLWRGRELHRSWGH
jgi:hypothetical protein